MPIDPTIRKWKNVTYQIEWYADGENTTFTEDPFCQPATGQSENDNPCPDNNEIRSLLKGNDGYEPGQWVRYFRDNSIDDFKIVMAFK